MVDEVNERLIEAVVLSMALGAIKRKAPTEMPIEIISSDVGARRYGDEDRRGKVGRFLRWCKRTEWTMRRPEDSGLTCC